MLLARLGTAVFCVVAGPFPAIVERSAYPTCWFVIVSQHHVVFLELYRSVLRFGSGYSDHEAQSKGGVKAHTQDVEALVATYLARMARRRMVPSERLTPTSTHGQQL